MVAVNLDVPLPIHIETDAEARKLLRLCNRKIEEDPNDFIGFDTETHGLKIPLKSGTPDDVKKNDPLDWMRDTVIFWSLAFKLGDQYERYSLRQTHLHIFVPFLECPKANLVAWNMKYDAHVSWNSNVNIWNSNAMDAMVMGHLANENTLPGQMRLKDVCRRKNGFIGKDVDQFVRSDENPHGEIQPWKPIPMTKFNDLFGTEDEYGNKIEEYNTSLLELPLDLVSDYASLDAYAHLKIAEHLQEVLSCIPIDDDYSMWNYFYDVEKEVTEVIWRMERRGLGVDKEYFASLIGPITKRLTEIAKEINREAGRVINVDSTQDLRILFFGDASVGGLGLTPIKQTKTGLECTDEGVLEELAANGVRLAKLVKNYRKVRVISSTYIRGLNFLAGWHDDGRIHPNIHQAGTRTGRFSMTVPNGQNMPRPGDDDDEKEGEEKWGYKIRRGFVAAKPNKVLIVGDYAQLEMRIMAHFSKDKGMLRAIREGMDLHCYAVEKMYGIPYAEVLEAKKTPDKRKTKRQWKLVELRQVCKNTGFAIIFGAGAMRVSIMLEIPKADAKRIIERYFQAFPGVRKFMARTISECKFDEYVKTIMGRRRRLPEINNHQFSKWSHAERESVNAIIQGTAADITKAAMLNIEFDKQLNLWGVNLLNQIHDELVQDCFREYAELALPLIQFHMENPFNGEPALMVSTPVDLKIVESWDQAK